MRGIRCCMAMALLAALAPSVRAADTVTLAPGVSSREIAAIPFVSVMDPPPREGTLVVPEAAIAVHFNQPQFSVGEPVTGWLLLHYLGASDARGLLTGFDLGIPGGKAEVSGSARLQLVRLAEGREQVVGEARPATTRLRNAPRVRLASGGYWVNSGDVRNLAAGRLDPGDYLLRFWAEGQRAAGRFSITPSSHPAGAAPGTAPRPGEQVLLAVNSGWEAIPRPAIRRGGAAVAAPAAPAQLAVRQPYFTLRSAEEFSVGLALGVGRDPETRYFPRLADVPASDPSLRISADRVAGNPDHIRITLTPQTPPTRPAAPATSPASRPAPPPTLRLACYPSVYLLVENLGPPLGPNALSRLYYNEREWGSYTGLITVARPLVIDLELGADWAQRTLFTGKVRVCAVVASDPVAPGPSAENPNPANEPSRGGAETRWVGILKSNPLELTLPPRDQ